MTYTDRHTTMSKRESIGKFNQELESLIEESDLDDETIGRLLAQQIGVIGSQKMSESSGDEFTKAKAIQQNSESLKTLLR